MECSFGGCDKQAFSRGLCKAHYEQQRKGKPLKPIQTQHHGLSEYDRFFKWVAIGKPSECWGWKGSRNKTHWHGQWRNAEGGIELAHRAAWRLMRGEIPGGLFVLHKCDNPICCNPTHLFLGTQSDNLSDMWAKKRARPGTSKGEDHGMAKITPDIVREIRSSGEAGSALARRFGLSPTTVCDIRKRRSWKHID